MDKAQAEHARLRANFRRLAATLDPATHTGERPRAAVVCWDLTHNPVGRALVLADLLAPEWDVDLVGPMWAQHGDRLWPPADGEIGSIRTFPASSIVDYLPSAVALAASVEYDLVVSSKYRLPAIHLATLLAEWSDAPLIVDMCDLESAVAPPVEEGPADMIDDLFDGPARRLEERSIELADARSVVSPTLQERFGGTIVRHARLPLQPADGVAAQAARRASRDRFGISDEEFALFYIGTVRRHKGVGDVVDALRMAADLDARLHVFTTTGSEELAELLGPQDQRWVDHGHCRLQDVPAVLAGADLVVLPQDPESKISHYQVPAKISDAAMLGCPVLAPDLPAYADLSAAGIVDTFAPGRLGDRISALAAARDGVRERRRRQLTARRELSIVENASRLGAVICEAAERRGTNERDSLILHEELTDLYEQKRPVDWMDEITDPAPEHATDIAFFWKQNDSDLYGRRHDMVIRHALQDGHARRAIQFDRPIDVGDLWRHVPSRRRLLPRNDEFLIRAALERHLEIRDEPRLMRRTFLHHTSPVGDGTPRLLLGTPIPARDEYLAWVERQLAAARMEPSSTTLWLWPHIDDVEALITSFDWHRIVVDLVDDERTWPHHDQARRDELHRAYSYALGRADAAFTNSQANADAFRDLGVEIELVPNGAEPAERLPRPEHDRPIIGYVGDMQHRLDWELVEAIAVAHPECDLQLIGEVTDDSPAHRIAGRHDNVVLRGVLPYEEAREAMASFSVAIVPHETSRQSQRMDPLKTYNYLAVGLPVVATDHPSAARLPGVRTASSHDEFLAGLDAALLDTNADPVDLTGLMWSDRVDAMFRHLSGPDGRPSTRRLRR